MSTYWINVPSGQTVHLRSEAETNTSNVITELPRGYPVTRVFSLDPFKYVSVWDCIDTIEGYVHQNYLTGVPSTCASDEMYIPRYSTPAWKRSSHSGKYYLPVKRIQSDLYDLGYTDVGTPDGYYGKNTETAVKAFQKDNNLTVDGIFGKNSKLALWELADRRGEQNRLGWNVLPPKPPDGHSCVTDGIHVSSSHVCNGAASVSEPTMISSRS